MNFTPLSQLPWKMSPGLGAWTWFWRPTKFHMK